MIPFFEYSFIMSFKENLKDELKYQDIKVKELADKTGIPKRTIDHYLTENSYMPSADNAVKIAQALHVSVEYLVTGEDISFQFTMNKKIPAITKKLIHLSDEDLDFFDSILDRLNAK